MCAWAFQRRRFHRHGFVYERLSTDCRSGVANLVLTSGQRAGVQDATIDCPLVCLMLGVLCATPQSAISVALLHSSGDLSQMPSKMWVYMDFPFKPHDEVELHHFSSRKRCPKDVFVIGSPRCINTWIIFDSLQAAPPGAWKEHSITDAITTRKKTGDVHVPQ